MTTQKVEIYIEGKDHASKTFDAVNKSLGEVSKNATTAHGKVSDFGGGLSKTGSQADETGNKLVGVAGGLAKVAAAGGALAVGGILAGSVSAAADFEKTISGIKAVSGATVVEMQQVQSLALQLGKDTSFSAKEAAKGIEELIKGGVAIPDVMTGGAKAMLALAAAGGVELPEAAEIAANAMSVFALTGADMAHVADLIAGAANASSLSVGDFRFSMAAAGAVAAQSGQKIDDLAQAVAVMGAAGLKGSDAGTSLKTFLMNLQPTTKAAVAEMRALGLYTVDETKAMEYLGFMLKQAGEPGLKAIAKHTKDGTLTTESLYKELQKLGKVSKDIDYNKWANETGLVTNSFINANGSFKSMAEIAGELQRATEGLTDAQKMQQLETIFGSDAIRAAAIFAKAGASGFNEMAASMGRVTAEGAAAERLNNFAGSMEQLKGSLETAGITLGMALLPMLRKLVDGLTGVVNASIPYIEQYGPGLVALFERIAGVVGDIGGKLLAGDIGGALASLMGHFQSAGGSLVAELGKWGQALLAWIAPMIPPLLLEAGKLVQRFFDWLGEKAPELLSQLGVWGAQLKDWIGPQIPVLLDEAGKLAGQLFEWLTDQVPLLMNNIKLWANQFIAWVEPAIADLLTEAAKLSTQLLDWITEQGPPLAQKFLSEWLPNALIWVVQLAADIIPKLLELIIAIGTWLVTTGIPKLLEFGAKMGGAILSGLATGLGMLAGELAKVISEQLSKLKIDIGPFHIDASGFRIDMPNLSLTTPNQNIPAYQSGGTVPLPEGRAQLAVVHGQELIITPEQRRKLGLEKEEMDRLASGRLTPLAPLPRGPAWPTGPSLQYAGNIVVNFNGPVYGMRDFESAVVRAIEEGRRRGRISI